MFELNEKLNRLDIPAQKVMRMHRSIGDVQIALPGQKSQLATAYICAFSAGKGARVAIALYLRDDYKLIFYLNAGGEVSSGNAGQVLREAIDFTESLGFMMNDVDIHKMNPSEKAAYWEGSTLKNPPIKPKAPEPAKAPERAPAAAGQEVVEATEELTSEEQIEIDLGLPRRPLAARGQKKERPTPAELEKKRLRLRENLGRFLSSL